MKKHGFAQAGIIVLDALLKLRQACCDPRLVKLDSVRKARQSATPRSAATWSAKFCYGLMEASTSTLMDCFGTSRRYH